MTVPDGRAAPVRYVRGENGRREPTPEAITRIMLRPVASSLPLGFLAFGTGSVLLTALELHWVPVAQGSTLMVMVLALEALAGLFAFLARDSGAATALPGAWPGTGRGRPVRGRAHQDPDARPSLVDPRVRGDRSGQAAAR
jgi:hypothetical protein